MNHALKSTAARFAPFNKTELHLIVDGLGILQPDEDGDAETRDQLVNEAQLELNAIGAAERDLQRKADHRAMIEKDAATLLAANGFTPEICGGGATMLSRYFPNGAYIHATNEEPIPDYGNGQPTATEFCVCVYGAAKAGSVYADDDALAYGPLLDIRHDSEAEDSPYLVDAIRMALAAAKAVDDAIAGGPIIPLADIANGAAERVKQRREIPPIGFDRWTDGIAQSCFYFDEGKGGAVLAYTLDGQSPASDEDFRVHVFTGHFDWSGCGEDRDVVEIHTIAKAAGITLAAAAAAGVAMLRKLTEGSR